MKINFMENGYHQGVARSKPLTVREFAMDEGDHSVSVRVYYEDTDFSGRVYHASFIRFFERGRTEWLRAIGFGHNALAQSSGTAFAVRRLQVEYLAAAFIDDLLEVRTTLLQGKGPVLPFQQAALRDGVPLVTASVDVVTIRDGRAVRPPREIVKAWLVSNIRQT